MSSTFSSVVRKPGQKIIPKTAPRRNIQRNTARHGAPLSLTPESQVESPNVEPVDESTQSEEAGTTQTVLESTEIPSLSQSVEETLPFSEPLETGERPSSEASAARIPSVSLEVIVPTSTNQGISIIHPTSVGHGRTDIVPTITTSSSSSTRPKRKATNEPTPAPSEESTQEVDNALPETSQSQADPRKRRKATRTAQSIRESQPTPPSDSTPSILRSSSRTRRSESRTSDALLQDATSQAAAVSELANSIERRSVRPRSARTPASQAETDDQCEDTATIKRKRSRKKQIRPRTVEELAQQVIDDAVSGGKDGKNRRQSRMSTPENAEVLEIDPEQISMGDLVKDNKIGKKSETEKRMRENWSDIQKRRKEEVERRREAAKSGRQAITSNQNPLVDPVEALVPKQIIVNGQIVVAAESREVAFGTGLEQAVIQDADVALEDDRIYKYVNQGTLGKKAGRGHGSRWDEERTDLFYKGLRMFGTDFGMISNLFPTWDRKQVKLKFLIEEKARPDRVRQSVAAKERVSLQELAQMTNQEFTDPGMLQAELDAEEKRLREEDERKRANEGYIDETADIALPTTERDEDAEEVADEETGSGLATRNQAASTDRRDRISSLAEAVVQAAVTPRRKHGQQRRTKEPAGRGRQLKKGRRPMEGVEERVGPIDEVNR